MKSGLFKLNLRDLLKGLITAVAAGVISTVISVAGTGSLSSLNFKVIGYTALIAGLGYISKNFLTDSDDKILGKY